TGAAGQLGYELQRTAPADTRVLAVDVDALDLTDAAAVERFIATHRPAVIINGAAYTAVDRAESQPDLAEAVNVTAAATVAASALRHDARVIQISTDFVFGGATARPWQPHDATSPESVYGRTKRDGEERVRDALGQRGLVIRTAWLYSAHGGNFVKTMLRLMRERDAVSVIADQIGSPTWANALARTIWAAVAAPQVSGTLHWSDAGVASWYDFAVAIQEEAISRGLLSRAVPVRAITTADYPTPARRPSYSVLDKSATAHALGVEPIHWRVNLRHMLDEMPHA
ncbi:MAG: dTDP-4-dehydrorhamnose reductase, partial [Gemmatimonadaceae bacterium]|nr:dTDP-4-dehydrorhamnose reductase [Gemmatimonadaceae bacterium]